MNVHAKSLPEARCIVQYSQRPGAEAEGERRSSARARLGNKAMQLPDEAVAYQYQSLLVPAAEEWSPAAELRAQHFLPPSVLRDLAPRLLQVRSQVVAERE